MHKEIKKEQKKVEVKKRVVGVRECGTRSDEEKKTNKNKKEKRKRRWGRVRECGTRSKRQKQKKEGEKGVGNEMLQRKSQKMEGNLEFFNRESSLIPTATVSKTLL